MKSATVADISEFCEKTDLVNLKLDFHRLDIVKLGTSPVNLIKLSDAVKDEVVKKTVYDELVKRVDTIQTTDTGMYACISLFRVDQINSTKIMTNRN